MTDPDSLPYRPCVGLMLLNADGLIWAGQRIDNPGPAWQMPQGGIDKGESPIEAGLRELEEETGVSRERVELLRESRGWIDYDLPPELKGKLWKGRYRGQTQKWLALRFLGEDREINIETAEPEFSRWAWMPGDELLGKIVPFKTHVYEAVFAEFGDLMAV